MKANTLFLTIIWCLTCNFTLAQKKIQVPYFKTLSGYEVCGSEYCNPKEAVIVGLSILTVSGTWTSDALKKTFAKFEANADAFKAMDANAKAEYETSKKKILEAQFQPFSMIFNVAYYFK